MKSRWLLIGSAALVFMGLLAGCSGSETDPEGLIQDAPASADPQPASPDVPADSGSSPEEPAEPDASGENSPEN